MSITKCPGHMLSLKLLKLFSDCLNFGENCARAPRLTAVDSSSTMSFPSLEILILSDKNDVLTLPR